MNLAATIVLCSVVALTLVVPPALFIAVNGWKATKDLAIYIWNL